MKHAWLSFVFLALGLAAFGLEVGDTVVVVAASEKETEVKKILPGDIPRGSHVVISGVNGKWLKVNWGSCERWVEPKDVLPLDDALTFFTEALEKNPCARDYCARGMIWTVKGSYNKAIADFDEALNLKPNYADAYASRGYAWTDKEQYGKAIEDYSEAIRLEPKDVDLFVCRAYAWRCQQKYDKAITDYNQAIRVDSKYADAYRLRGQAWCEKEEYDRAIKDYNEALRLDVKNPYAHFCRGNAWEIKRQYKKAIADYEESIQRNPKIKQPRNALAWILATCPEGKCRDGAKAVELATKVCEQSNWKNSFYLDTVAVAYAEKGNFKEAIKWQEKALALCSDEDKPELQSRLNLYRSGKPYRDEPAAFKVSEK